MSVIKLRIKLYLFWFLLQGTIIYTCVVNVLFYDTNVEDGKKYKISLIYNKTTYFIDCLMLIYVTLIITLFTTILHCIYGVLSYEVQVFSEEAKNMLENNDNNIERTLELLSKKHIKLFSMLIHGIKGLEQYTNVVVMNFSVMIIFSVSVFRYYLSTGNYLEAVGYVLVIISSASIILLLLVPILFIDRNALYVKNIILNNTIIWEKKNYKLQPIALGIIHRIENCEYHGKLLGMIPFDERTLPFILLFLNIFSILLGTAIF
uniref:Gustatory receptor n=1 Tax=Parastrongyloides trichosuri TaxID=131310 RepID=A0A0N4Z5J9_PARTI